MIVLKIGVVSVDFDYALLLCLQDSVDMSVCVDLLFSRYPDKVMSCVSEIVQDENVDFLQEETLEPTVKIYTHPLFAQGIVFADSICTTLLVQVSP